MAMRTLFLCACAVVPAASAVAQCPDGSPPPCPGQRVALNPGRIAILPFRVTAADTLLGQGLAELLAPEFTGENGPLAVNMPTVLRTWRRAGGGTRTPLDPAQARGVAQAVGAGRLVDGSVVGVGGRITVTATVTELPEGTTRRVGPLSGPADSLEDLVGRLASGLLGATGGTPVDLHIRLTDSPAAMRAYLEGIAQFRAGNFTPAAAAFERAFALDTLFARAALMRLVAGPWAPALGVDGWDSVTWRVRDRLSAQDRILLTALLGSHFPALRTPEEHLADRRRAAMLLPQSAEAQFELGDYLFHEGAANDIADDFASARAQLELAYRIDPQAEGLEHLVVIGLFTGDTGLVRRAWEASRQVGGDGTDTDRSVGRVVALVLGDRALEARYAAAPPYASWLARAATSALRPADDVARLFADNPRIHEPPNPSRLWASPSYQLSLTAINTGRLARLPDSSLLASADWQLTAAALAFAGDSIVAARLAVPSDTARWDSEGGALRSASLALIEALRSRRANLREPTVRLDSLLRWTIANWDLELGGYEAGLLAVAWERLGDTRRALAALHLVRWGARLIFALGPNLRQEGRLAAIVGDTARAIRAYRRYLSLRRDADPVLIPERDSVQAALARLERR